MHTVYHPSAPVGRPHTGGSASRSTHLQLATPRSWCHIHRTPTCAGAHPHHSGLRPVALSDDAARVHASGPRRPLHLLRDLLRAAPAAGAAAAMHGPRGRRAHRRRAPPAGRKAHHPPPGRGGRPRGAGHRRVKPPHRLGPPRVHRRSRHACAAEGGARAARKRGRSRNAWRISPARVRPCLPCMCTRLSAWRVQPATLCSVDAIVETASERPFNSAWYCMRR